MRLSTGLGRQAMYGQIDEASRLETYYTLLGFPLSIHPMPGERLFVRWTQPGEPAPVARAAERAAAADERAACRRGRRRLAVLSGAGEPVAESWLVSPVDVAALPGRLPAVESR